MASNLRYFPTAEDVVIPWEQDYEFPSVANKAIKISPRITPSNGNSPIQPGGTVQFTFPAQGFLDGRRSTISFDLWLKGYDNYDVDGLAVFKETTGSYVYLQNNISSIFKHAKLSYGSYQPEQIQENGFLQRQLCELSGYGAEDNDQAGITKGIGGCSSWAHDDGSVVTVNNRQMIHTLINDINTLDAAQKVRIRPCTQIVNGATYAVRRYQCELPFGVMQQGKLIPIKYMASQLQMEFTLCSADEIILANNNNSSAGNNAAGSPSFFIQNVVLHPEMLEFDQTYEARFIRGLETGGVPIQFSTFRTYISPLNSSFMSIAIPEKSRSVKAIFAFVRRQQHFKNLDTGASFGDFENNVLESYQYRVGGRYFPASPCMNTLIPGHRTGSVEPFIELQKALKVFGDPTVVAAVNPDRWNKTSQDVGLDNLTYPTDYAATDGKLFAPSIDAKGFIKGAYATFKYEYASRQLSGVFCMAATMETSNGRELSGLNAEEQSDIVLNIKYQSAPPPGFEVVVYTLVDKVMVVKENNYVDINE